MRKLCPNYDRENGLDTVLEVPIPEEMFVQMGSSAALRWHNLRALMKAQNRGVERTTSYLQARSNDEFIALLKLAGSPLVPFQVQFQNRVTKSIRDSSICLPCPPIFKCLRRDNQRKSFWRFWCSSPVCSFLNWEASTAKYILQQYIAATGGMTAFNEVSSMYALGQVKMIGSEMHRDDDSVHATGNCEVGGFVVWQKNPDLWSLELVVAGFKVSAGSDGKVSWNQTSSQPCHAHRGPPRPVRRFFQGLDPRCTANLFSDAVCIGEKSVNKEDCFVLKLEAPSYILRAQCTNNTDIVHHTVWGYFSQRTGLLVKLEDTKLVRMKNVKGHPDGVFWETSMESIMDDYRYIDSINIAHSGKTVTTLYRYGEAHNHKRKIEETWKIEEVDFNICGLSLETFLPPADMKREHDYTGE